MSSSLEILHHFVTPQGVRTVQGEVEKALSLVFRVEVKTVGASRTDSGVHARGRSADFDILENPVEILFNPV